MIVPRFCSWLLILRTPPPPPPPCRLFTSRVCGSNRIAGPEGAFPRAGARAGQHTVHNKCHRGEIFAGLGCYIPQIGSYRRFGTNVGSHLQGALEDGTDRLSRNVVNYQSALGSVPQERKPEITQSPHHVRMSLVVMEVRRGVFHGLYQTDDAAVGFSILKYTTTTSTDLTILV
jgi:hypothetical protein